MSRPVLGEGKIARGSLLAATLTASLNFEADDEDAEEDKETEEPEVIKGTVREETIGRATSVADAQPTRPRPKTQRLKDAFGKHDLYGDAAAPGEISWSSLPAGFGRGLGPARAVAPGMRPGGGLDRRPAALPRVAGGLQAAERGAQGALRGRA